jgi:hypothetical protein
LTDEILTAVRQNLLSDFVELLDPTTSEAMKQMKRGLASSTLTVARAMLDEADPTADPLVLWPTYNDLSILFPLVQMYFGMAASTAENERSFSSASFVMGEGRTRLDMDNFRREHRIRRFICAGAPSSTKEGRELRSERAERLLTHYANAVQELQEAVAGLNAEIGQL